MYQGPIPRRRPTSWTIGPRGRTEVTLLGRLRRRQWGAMRVQWCGEDAVLKAVPGTRQQPERRCEPEGSSTCASAAIPPGLVGVGATAPHVWQ